MTDDTIVHVVTTFGATAALWIRMRQSVPLTTYQPKITELHNTINELRVQVARLEERSIK